MADHSSQYGGISLKLYIGENSISNSRAQSYSSQTIKLDQGNEYILDTGILVCLHNLCKILSNSYLFCRVRFISFLNRSMFSSPAFLRSATTLT